jgi:hypothetical protein
MRTILKVAAVVGVLAVAAAGLGPPLLDQGALDTDARNAARTASATLVDANGPDLQTAESAAQGAVAGDKGVTVAGVSVDGQTVQVTLEETVHSFLDGLPGLSRHYFRLSSTAQSTFGG